MKTKDARKAILAWHCKVYRKLTIALLPFISRLHSAIRKVPTNRAPRLGVYSAYYNSSAYFSAHLASVFLNSKGPLDYYVQKNFTSESESLAFDEIVKRHPEVTVFNGVRGRFPCPLSHGDSLERMVSLTDNEIIVICDIDSLLLKAGWDEFVREILEEKIAVGVLAFFHNRKSPRQHQLVLHPSFLAFRRSLLKENSLDLRAGDGNDPAYKITRHLIRNDQFNRANIHPLVPSSVEYPNGWFEKNSSFDLNEQPSHGFCTRYDDLFFHFWHSMNYSEARDIISDSRSVLVPHDVVIERVKHYTALYGDNLAGEQASQ